MTGTGTALDPLIILTASDLNDVRLNMSESVYYKLGADIDLSAYDSWVPIGDNTQDNNARLDGAGFTIRNMHITSAVHHTTWGATVGLFGYTTTIGPTSSYFVKDLIMESCSINLNNYLMNTIPFNFVSSGDIKIGILMGECADYVDSYYTITSESQWNKISNVQIRSCSINLVKTNVGLYPTESLYDVRIGGLVGNGPGVGLITSCSIDGLSITGHISGTHEFADAYIGGMASLYYMATYNSVKNSYVQFLYKWTDPGSPNYSFPNHNPRCYISGFGDAGGDIDVHDNYVYNTIVSGALHVAGFANDVYVFEGYFPGIEGFEFPSGRKYTNATFATTPTESVWAFTETYTIGYDSASAYNYFETSSIVYPNPTNPSSFPVEGLTTAQMKNSASYVGFDFQNVWLRNDNSQSGYPYLSWETVPYTPSAPVSYDILTILTPNGGEKYRFGNTVPITWSVTQSYDLVIQGFTP